jgi:quercetin dioxygenase-like cupin family protein
MTDTVVPATPTPATSTSATSSASGAAVVPPRGPRLVPPGAGATGAAVPGLPTAEVKLAAADGAGFSLIEYTIPAGFAPPPHLHRHTREGAVTYLLDGELHYWFTDHDTVLTPGTLLQLPPGVWFRWANETDAPARVLAMFSPGGFEQFFLDVAAAVADGTDLGEAIGPLRARYGDEDQPSR